MIPEPGISERLATSRAARIARLHYALAFDLPRDPSHPVEGRVTLTFTLASSDEPLVLDFAGGPEAVTRMVVNGQALVPAVAHGHIAIQSEALVDGTNEIEIAFVAGDGPLNRRDGYLYTIFVPARAHEAFPCFDQPDLKAGFALTLSIPDDWEAVSNAPERTRRVDSHAREGTALVVSFEDTDPLPTYLVAFAAGRFSVETAFRSGHMIRMYHREDDDDLVARNRRAIIDQHVAALAWLEDYTRVPYSFMKFDIVLLPAFQFGGMEHPGAIFYNASSLLLDLSATRHQQIARAHLIAHETAHMWFGNLVTMRWFADVWVKEVFANLMAAKIVAPAFPEFDHDLHFLHGHYPAAYDVDRTAGTHPIRQRLDDLRDAASLYGPIIYLKSPIVMRQLEQRLGADALRDGLREYLRRFAFSAADWPDLLDILQARTALDLRAWNRDWIEAAGRPTIEAVPHVANGVLQRLELQDRQPGGSGRAWPQPLVITMGSAEETTDIAVEWTGPMQVPAAAGRGAPSFILLNGHGLGYGEFRLDARSRAWLLMHLPELPDALTRASAWITLWDEVLGGRVEPVALLALALTALQRERVALNRQRILAYLERLFWILLTDDERARSSTEVEHVLRGLIDEANERVDKASAFATFRNLALTDGSLDWLHTLQRGEAIIEGLPLADADRTTLALELAVRGWRDVDGRLADEQRRLASDERREALRFLAPAVSPDARTREAFFDRLRDPAQRRREPWVVEGLRWLHHPLRQAHARTLIRPGLDLLAEVQRTADIFLPKRWADATLGGHASPEAAAIVRAFLDSRAPTYPVALHRLVLQASDLLFRAATVRGVSPP